MTYSLLLDIVLVVLLVATIGYAMVLNRKLGSLRGHKEELEKLAAAFAESTARAKDSIASLKNSTVEMQADIAKASGLKDDLRFLIDRGSSAADRLEAAVRKSRGENETRDRPTVSTPRSPVETAAHMETSRNMNNGANGNFSSEMEKSDTSDRSQAERELIEALRSVR